MNLTKVSQCLLPPTRAKKKKKKRPSVALKGCPDPSEEKSRTGFFPKETLFQERLHGKEKEDSLVQRGHTWGSKTIVYLRQGRRSCGCFQLGEVLGGRGKVVLQPREKKEKGGGKRKKRV